MIGSVVGGLIGGFVSESLDGSFTLGSAIVRIVVGIIGEKVSDSTKFHLKSLIS